MQAAGNALAVNFQEGMRSLHSRGKRVKGTRTCELHSGLIRKGDVMAKKPVMSEEVFAAMLDQAIQDLRNSGMDTGEIFTIVEECFGSAYARRFCQKSN
jgi:hypothetical protein